MGDVITRFRLETSQYDSKLRDASKGLADLAREASKAGDDFGTLAKETLDAAKAFGNISASATNSKDKVKELVGAFNDVAKVYNNLSDEQKRNDVGKAISASLEKLKKDIADAKSEMNSTNSVLSQLKEKFTINIDAIKLFNIGVKAAEGALQVAKDAFFASEQNLDDWNRAVYAAESTYQAFLTSLNTGDISGFLSRINDIVSAASSAYNAMDALATQKAINNPAVQAQQAENQRFRTMLMTRRYIAPSDGRSTGGMKTGQILTDDQLKVIERMLEGGMKTLTAYTEKEIKATTKAIEKLYDEQATRLGMSKSQFLAGTKDYDTFARNLERAMQYRDFESQRNYVRQLANSGQSLTPAQSAILNSKNPNAGYAAWGVFKDDGELYNLINQYINQRAGLQSQVYGQYGQAYRSINRVEGITSRRGGGGGAGDKLVSAEIKATTGFEILAGETWRDYESMASLRKTLQKYQEMLDNATNGGAELAAISGINATRWKMSDVGRQAAKLGLDENAYKDLQQQINDGIAQMDISPIEIKAAVRGVDEVAKDGEKITAAWSTAGQVINSVGRALNNIENPAAKIVAIVAEAIANIAAGYAAAIGKEGKNSKNIWAFIASAAAAVVEMGVSIAQVHKATGYAQGGIVEGSAYSGDNVGPVMLNAGELVLTKAQQNNIASQLTGKSAQQSSQTYTTGETIFLGVNNYLNRIGRGEIVTSK